MPFALDMLGEVQRKLDKYAACECCATHCGCGCSNKPTKWEPWVELCGGDGFPRACKCPCRHNARVLCRMHPDCKTLGSLEPAMQAKADRLLAEPFRPGVRGGRTLSAATPENLEYIMADLSPAMQAEARQVIASGCERTRELLDELHVEQLHVQQRDLKQELEKRVWDMLVSRCGAAGSQGRVARQLRVEHAVEQEKLLQDLAGFKIVVIPTTNDARKKFGWPENCE